MELTKENIKRRDEIVRELLPKAIPGNSYWRRIEALQGYDADYTEADHGMHWSDNKKDL